MTGFTHQASSRWGAGVTIEVGDACGATADIQTSVEGRGFAADRAKVSGDSPGGVNDESLREQLLEPQLADVVVLAGRRCAFSISTRAQVFQRRTASSFPAGLSASAWVYQRMARRKPS